MPLKRATYTFEYTSCFELTQPKYALKPAAGPERAVIRCRWRPDRTLKLIR
jgi:hypothetical protein